MTANELRIGNMVYRQYQNHKAEIIETEIQDIVACFENKDFTFTGIPLTPEILEAAGFERHINEMNIDGIEMLMKIRDKVELKSCGKLNGGIVVMFLCRGNYFANNVEYLHELQNAFYFITGSDLRIQLR